jgi:hypothetical protein
MSSADPVADPQVLRVPTDAVRPRPTFFSRLATRYVDGWTWYARAGYSPPAPEPGFPMTRQAPPQPCCIELGRTAEPRFALLFGAAR